MSEQTQALEGGMSGREIRLSPEDQFKAGKHILNRVKIDADTNCWNWSLKLSRAGYAYTNWNGKKVRASRLSYAATFSVTPNNLQACHKCDNRACVNPLHIFIGTQQDNTRDAVSKNRQRITRLRGDDAPWSKLTSSDVINIRLLCRNGVPQSKISELFKISQAQVWKIKEYRRWKHI